MVPQSVFLPVEPPAWYLVVPTEVYRHEAGWNQPAPPKKTAINP
jgi:hypothetical protein